MRFREPKKKWTDLNEINLNSAWVWAWDYITIYPTLGGNCVCVYVRHLHSLTFVCSWRGCRRCWIRCSSRCMTKISDTSLDWAELCCYRHLLFLLCTTASPSDVELWISCFSVNSGGCITLPWRFALSGVFFFCFFLKLCVTHPEPPPSVV